MSFKTEAIAKLKKCVSVLEAMDDDYDYAHTEMDDLLEWVEGSFDLFRNVHWKWSCVSYGVRMDIELWNWLTDDTVYLIDLKTVDFDSPQEAVKHLIAMQKLV